MLKRRLLSFLPTIGVGAVVAASLPGGSLITAILGISFLIFIHEWGHFMACRLTGTRTETFSIGFGPRLLGWEKDREGRRRFTTGRRQLDAADHAMDFRVAAIPLGGYVKMAGEIPGEYGDRPPADDEFPAKSAWARIFIVCAGVIMNFVTAVVFYFLTFQFEKSFRAPVVGDVAAGGAAWEAGLKPGDRVKKINGNGTPTWIDLQMEVAFLDRDEPAPFIVERSGKELDPLLVTPNYDEERGILAVGIFPVIGLELGKGAGVFAIGHDEAVTVSGAPVRGGAEALSAISLATLAGINPIPLAKPDGSTYELAAVPPADGKKPESPGAKIGLSRYAPPVVKAARGNASKVLEEGDHLLSVESRGKTVLVGSDHDASRLMFLPSIESIRILRQENELTRAVALATQADVAAFLSDVSLDSPAGIRVRPLEAGHLLFTGKGLYRYDTSPALDAGVPTGARVMKVGKRITRTWDDIRKAIEQIPSGEPLTLALKLEDGTERELEVRPVELTYLGEISLTQVPYVEHWKTDGVFSAMGMGFNRTVRETKNVFRTIGALFSGTISFNKNIAGPITLVTASKRFAENSWLQLVWFLAYVSVMLAVLNILPIPVLDGGHLMFILIEKVKGSPLKDETMYNFQKVGFLLLLVLMFFAFKNDFSRLFS